MCLNGRPSVCFDPEGLLFAVGVNSEFVKLYDLRSFDKVRVISSFLSFWDTFQQITRNFRVRSTVSNCRIPPKKIANGLV